MTRDPIVIGPEALVTEAELLLRTYRVSGLPVVDNGELVGVIAGPNSRASTLLSAATNTPRTAIGPDGTRIGDGRHSWRRVYLENIACG